MPCRSFYVSYFYLLCAISAFIFVSVRIEKKYRKREFLCTVCGYDLRATRERCPECGTEIDVNNR